jgi:Mitochondrial carrier protein
MIMWRPRRHGGQDGDDQSARTDQNGIANGRAHGAASSIIAIYRHILQTEGIRGLWAGNGANRMARLSQQGGGLDVYRKWLTTTAIAMQSLAS